jgi:uncharacterized protein (DUF1499 family)
MNFKNIFYLIFMTLSTSNYAAEKALAPCPSSPNCVSSQAADAAHFIAPFKIVGAVDVAYSTLKNILLRQDRTVITRETEHSLHAEVTSLVFRFVDDVDIILDSEARLFHIRSASRVGYGDFGVNRKRVENLRSQLQATGIIE